MWQNLYDVDSPSWELFNYIQSTFFLVALIDNDYLRRDSLFDTLLRLDVLNDDAQQGKKILMP